jgi:O-antigen/teichoic acid export membrane protein
MSRLKKLGKDILIYGLSGVFVRSISFLLIPIYTRIFNPADYGDINIINNTAMILGLFSTFALDSAAHRWYYETEDKNTKYTAFSNWFWFQLVFSIILVVLLYLSIPILNNLFFKHDHYNLILFIVGLTLVFNILPNMLTNWYRVNLHSKKTVVFTTVNSVLNILLNIFFILILKLGILGFFASTLCVAFFSSLFAYYEMRLPIKFEYFDLKILKSMISYSFPLIPAALSYWILNNTDAYFLLYFLDRTQVGIFAIGVTIASVMSFFTSSFQTAIGPFAFSIMNQKDCKEIYASIFDFYTYLAVFFSFNLLFFAPELLRIFTQPAFYGASWVIGILGINLILIGYTYIASIGNSIVKENKYYMHAMIIATLLTIGLNIILIPRYGVNGSAIATLIAQLVVPIYLFYYSQKNFYVPYKFKKNIILIVIILSFAVFFRLFINIDSIYQIILKIIVSIIISSFVIYKALIKYKNLNIR